MRSPTFPASLHPTESNLAPGAALQRAPARHSPRSPLHSPAARATGSSVRQCWDGHPPPESAELAVVSAVGSHPVQKPFFAGKLSCCRRSPQGGDRKENSSGSRYLDLILLQS